MVALAFCSSAQPVLGCWLSTFMLVITSFRSFLYCNVHFLVFWKHCKNALLKENLILVLSRTERRMHGKYFGRSGALYSLFIPVPMVLWKWWNSWWRWSWKMGDQMETSSKKQSNNCITKLWYRAKSNFCIIVWMVILLCLLLRGVEMMTYCSTC